MEGPLAATLKQLWIYHTYLHNLSGTEKPLSLHTVGTFGTVSKNIFFASTYCPSFQGQIIERWSPTLWSTQRTKYYTFCFCRQKETLTWTVPEMVRTESHSKQNKRKRACQGRRRSPPKSTIWSSQCSVDNFHAFPHVQNSAPSLSHTIPTRPSNHAFTTVTVFVVVAPCLPLLLTPPSPNGL